jgi:hypothetical protein
MHLLLVVFLAMSAAGFDSSPSGQEGCRAQPLLKQERDVTTVRRLEAAWQKSYVTGDVMIGKCLLDRGFIELLVDGEIIDLKAELATVKEKNKGNSSRHLPISSGKFLIHGNAAVAYGRTNTSWSRSGSIPFADYFVWERDSWHVYFSRQTEHAPKPNW